MKNIETIVQELLAIDPSFADHTDEIRHLISELVTKKPDTKLDEAFVAGLRARLLGAPTPSPYSFLYSSRYVVVGVLAVFIALPAVYLASQRNTGSAVFAMNQNIERVAGNAYGTLAAVDGGRDAALATGSEIAPATAPGQTKMAANYASDSRMMIPNGEITSYSYIYTGEPLTLDSSGDVYNRTHNAAASGQIAAQLRKFNFGLLNLNAYASARVRSFELVEDTPFGYAISVNFDEGTVSINANYNVWPSLNGKGGAPEQLPKSAMPSNDEILAIAKDFLDSHDISLANYADPIIQDYAPMGIADSQIQYAPEQITITYPLKISDTPVYEDGGYPYGLQVGISIRDKKVMSVYGLTAQTYSSSSYTLETDSAKLLAVLGRGGPHAWVPQESPEVKIKKVEVEVGTPTKVLMHTYSYSNGESKELFVPAYSFPVTKAPAGEFYTKAILVPLVPELLKSEQGPIMYDMMR